MAEETPVRFEHEEGWVDLIHLPDEEKAEIKEKFTSTVVSFPGKNDENVRLDLADGEEIIGVKRPQDLKGNVVRIEFKILNTIKFSQEISSRSIKDIGGFKIDEKTVENTEVDKIKVFEDPVKMVWLFSRFTEMQKLQDEKYGGGSKVKN